MGTVYLGHQVEGTDTADLPSADQRLVAIKVIRSDLSQIAAYRERFWKEASAARRVAPFCTAEVLDVSLDDPRPYLVTEFIDGLTLARVVRERGKLAATEVQRLAIAVASALTVIHAAGIVHRDLKPGNIIMSPSGARVIDFGIARAVDADATMTSASVGTPAYMAPEQVIGEKEISTAADVHAWGAVVLFAATGRSPFGEGTPMTLQRRILDDSPDLGVLPDPLRVLVRDAMAKDPAQRPSAEELLLRLHRIDAIRDTQVIATPSPVVTPAGRTHRWSRRWTALVVGVVCVVTAAVVVPLTVSGHHRRPIPHDPPIAARQAWSRQLAAASTSMADPALARALSLAAYRTAPTPEARLRVLALLAQGGHALSATLTNSGFAYVATFSPDRRTLATASDDRTIRLWDVTDPAWPRPLATLTGHADRVQSVAYSPDSHILATASDDRTARLWNVTDPARPQLIATLTGHADIVHAVAFSPDGHTLATGSSDGTVRLWNVTDPTSPQPTATLTSRRSPVATVAYSPDGHTLATGSYDGTVRLWNVTDPASPQPTATITAHTGIVWTVMFSPDGHTLATASDDHTARLWNVTDPGSPQPLATLTAHTDVVAGAAFSPDGHTLATASVDRTIHLWDVTNPTSPQPIATLTGHTGTVRSPAFSPDGLTLATAADDDTVRLWDLDPNRLVALACADPADRLTADQWHQFLPDAPYQQPCA
jgi:WD40 repeat protein